MMKTDKLPGEHVNKAVGLILLGIFALVGGVGATCNNGRVIAKSVNEAARAACEATFGEDPPPEGISIEEICQEHERLQPFVDAILGARRDVAEGLDKKAPDDGE